MMTFEPKPYNGSRLDASIELGQKLADQWGTHALMIQMSRDIAKQWNTHGRLDEARAVQVWINRRVRYVPDPHAAEMIADPLTTIKNGGDCDDQAVLAAALLQAIGHDARIGAVTWKGRDAASHAVAVDLTAGCVVDPCSVSPEAWPPRGYEVQSIRYRNKNGQMESLSGLFSKAWKSIAKVVQKVLPAKTVLGKIADPLGLTDPKRNLNLAGRVADVAGTAAALAVGAYAIGAGTAAAATGSAGSAGGFWATAGLGAQVAGAAVGTGVSSLVSGAGSAAKFLLPALLAGGIGGTPQQAAGPAQPGGLTPEQVAAWQGAYGSDYTGGGAGGYASGGGGGTGAYTLPDGTPLAPGRTATNYTPMLALGAAAVALYLLTSKPKGKAAAHV